MPAHPVSRLVRFTLAVGANVILDRLGYRRHRVGASPSGVSSPQDEESPSGPNAARAWRLGQSEDPRVELQNACGVGVVSNAIPVTPDDQHWAWVLADGPPLFASVHLEMSEGRSERLAHTGKGELLAGALVVIRELVRVTQLRYVQSVDDVTNPPRISRCMPGSRDNLCPSPKESRNRPVK